MYNHPSSPFPGPVTQARSWWADDKVRPRFWLQPFDLEEVAMNSRDDESLRGRRSIRWELVHRVRREIADGIYETPEKWDVALDRLMDRLNSGKEATTVRSRGDKPAKLRHKQNIDASQEKASLSLGSSFALCPGEMLIMPIKNRY